VAVFIPVGLVGNDSAGSVPRPADHEIRRPAAAGRTCHHRPGSACFDVRVPGFKAGRAVSIAQLVDRGQTRARHSRFRWRSAEHREQFLAKLGDAHWVKLEGPRPFYGRLACERCRAYGFVYKTVEWPVMLGMISRQRHNAGGPAKVRQSLLDNLPRGA
jgi:hypothetical protein